jgi:hypothetical protein
MKSSPDGPMAPSALSSASCTIARCLTGAFAPLGAGLIMKETPAIRSVSDPTLSTGSFLRAMPGTVHRVTLVRTVVGFSSPRIGKRRWWHTLQSVPQQNLCWIAPIRSGRRGQRPGTKSSPETIRGDTFLVDETGLTSHRDRAPPGVGPSAI